MSNWGQRDDPSQLSSGERADHVAAELQAAFGGPASDVQRVCNLLCWLRQQFSEQAPKNWPLETVKRLWQSIIGALRVAQAPEVQVAACAAVEALGQSCSSCTDLERELSAVEDAIGCVLDTLGVANSRQVKAAGIKALLSLSGCLNCRCYYDKATQEVLGERGAIEVLLSLLPRFLADAVEAQQPQQQQCGGATSSGAGTGTAAAGADGSAAAAAAVADIFRTLHYTCLLNAANTTRLVAEGGYELIVQGLSALGKDLNVQEHGAMLISEMACSGMDVGRAYTDSIVAVANIARLQLQDKYIEVARAAVWSLCRLASFTLAGSQPQQSCSAAVAGAALPSARVGSGVDSVRRAQAWRLLSDPVLRVVVSMLQSCHMQDDPLVKHCLDYIAIVASAAPLFSSSSSSAGFVASDLPPSGGEGCVDLSIDGLVVPDTSLDEVILEANSDSSSSGGSGALQARLVSLMRLATEAVYSSAREAKDVRLQAVVLRTLNVLLRRFPGCAALQLGNRRVEIAGEVARIAAAARVTLEQQQAQALQQQQGQAHGSHHNQHHSQQAAQQASQQIAASKDLFLVHLYSLTVAAAVVAEPAGGSPAPSANGCVAPGGGSYQSHVLACLTGVVRHLSEGGGGDTVTYKDDDSRAPSGSPGPRPGMAAVSSGGSFRLAIGSCRYACHCCFIHDAIRGSDVLAGGRAAARLLVWSGGPEGVNATDRDGCGALHVLAAGGVAPLLAAFIDAAGSGLDFLRRTRAGANALQLARGRKHTAAMHILEVATEAAAKAAQDALLRELEGSSILGYKMVVSASEVMT